LVCQLSGFGRYAGRLDLWLDKRTGVIRSHRYRVFTNREWSYPPDLKVSSRMTEIREETGKDWERVIGMVLQDMALSSGRESALGNLVADSLRVAAQTEVAFQDIAGIKAPIFKGNITSRDVFQVLPDNRMIVVMELNGSRIKELLEEVLSSDKPVLQVSGLVVRYDPRRPPGRRVVSLKIGGAEAEDDRFYTVAIPDVLAMDENRFQVLREGRNWRLTGIVARDALVGYISDNTPIFFGSFQPGRLIRV
jgi:2',3'-cyclic-nucleotide 2'-phosphodiesterase (5'-nucleotidase family)